MAGATTSGTRSRGRAKHMRLTSSSARPTASLAIRSALAGAISTASASRVRLMWGMLLGSEASHWWVNTLRPLRACIVTGVMNWQAASVMTTCTEAPALTSKRHNSADL